MPCIIRKRDVHCSCFGNQSVFLLSSPPALYRTHSAVITASLYVYAVNPRSQHREEVIACLAYLSRHKDGEMHAFLYKDASPRLFPAYAADEQQAVQTLDDLRQQLKAASPAEK